MDNNAKYNFQQFVSDYKHIMRIEMHYVDTVPKWVYAIVVTPEVYLWYRVVRRYKRKRKNV